VFGLGLLDGAAVLLRRIEFEFIHPLILYKMGGNLLWMLKLKKMNHSICSAGNYFVFSTSSE
jgi:hypothetical protein